jgi:hypothetical protein
MKRLIMVVGTIAILLVSGFQCYAQGKIIHGCSQKSDGQLRIVNNISSCRPSESSISWNVEGPTGPQGPIGPQGPQGLPAPQGSMAKEEQIPRVYDAKEQFLGILPQDLDGFLSVFIPSLSKFIFISPDNGDVSPFYPMVYAYFDGDGCTGNVYVDIGMRYLIFKMGSQYFAADSVTAEQKALRSQSVDYGSGRTCLARSTNIPVLPCKEVKLPFAMPVALPLHFE